MNILLWIAQVALTFVFFMAGATKLFHYESFVEKTPPMKTLPKGLVKFIGFCEILGAVGVIVPIAFGIFPFLTPVAALGLATVMMLAIGFHAKRGEWKALPMPLLLIALALFVAYGRWDLLALPPNL